MNLSHQTRLTQTLLNIPTYSIIKYLKHCFKIKVDKVCKVNQFYGVERNKTIIYSNDGFVVRVKDAINN